MSISSDIDITREKALKRVFNILMSQQEMLVRKAVNAMSNDELASELHTDMAFYHVSGEGRIKEPWEEEESKK